LVHVAVEDTLLAVRILQDRECMRL
jgi:hypothetical protein